MKKYMYIVLGIVAVAIVILAYGLLIPPKVDAYPLKNVEVTLYKDMSCGCCGVYESYLQNKGMLVREGDGVDVAGIKEKLGIPVALRSCHTIIVGDYFVEGHIPVEAIGKLLREKPDIAGIALPEMPSGSPGMPGGKQGPFIIYAVGKDGSTKEFMRI